MRNEKVYNMTVIAVFTAIIVIMAFVPWLGYITIGAISITLIHIPVLIGGIFGGRRVSLSLGLVFGLSSLIVALTRPVTPVDLLFQNPLISVLPRVIFGWALYEIYLLFRKVIKQEYISIPVSMAVSTFVHTILVIGALYLFAQEEMIRIVGTTFLPLLWAIIGSNGVWEILVALIIGGPIADRLLAYRRSARG